jgi:hypothetical protein
MWKKNTIPIRNSMSIHFYIRIFMSFIKYTSFFPIRTKHKLGDGMNSSQYKSWLEWSLIGKYVIIIEFSSPLNVMLALENHHYPCSLPKTWHLEIIVWAKCIYFFHWCFGNCCLVLQNSRTPNYSSKSRSTPAKARQRQSAVVSSGVAESPCSWEKVWCSLQFAFIEFTISWSIQT